MGEFEGVSEDVCRGWGVVVSYLIQSKILREEEKGVMVMYRVFVL
jgi:hypothetical protein